MDHSSKSARKACSNVRAAETPRAWGWREPERLSPVTWSGCLGQCSPSCEHGRAPGPCSAAQRTARAQMRAGQALGAAGRDPAAVPPSADLGAESRPVQSARPGCLSPALWARGKAGGCCPCQRLGRWLLTWPAWSLGCHIWRPQNCSVCTCPAGHLPRREWWLCLRRAHGGAGHLCVHAGLEGASPAACLRCTQGGRGPPLLAAITILLLQLRHCPVRHCWRCWSACLQCS